MTVPQTQIAECLTKELKCLTLTPNRERLLDSPNVVQTRDSVFPTLKRFLLPTEAHFVRRRLSSQRDDGCRTMVPVPTSDCETYSSDDSQLSSPVFGGMISRPRDGGSPLVENDPTECKSLRRNLLRSESFNDSAYCSVGSSMFSSDSKSDDECEVDVKPVFENFIRATIDVSSDEGFEGSGLSSPECELKSRPVPSVKWRSPVKFQPYRTRSRNILKDSPCRIPTGKVTKVIRQISPVKSTTVTRIDFITQFHTRGMAHLVRNVFSRLSGCELQQSSEVSDLWRRLTSEEPFTEQRATFRTEDRKIRKSLNHNRSPNWRETCTLKSRRFYENRTQPTASPSKVGTSPTSNNPKLKHWLSVKRNLMQGEAIDHCPMCNFPSKRLQNNKGICSLARCLNEFCCLCKDKWHVGCCNSSFPRLQSSPYAPQSRLKIKRKLRKL